MLTGDPTQKYLPDLKRARAEGLALPEGEPLVQERWSALFVIAAILRRRSWKEEILQHEENVSHVPRVPPAVPQGFVTGTHVTIDNVRQYGPCPDCTGPRPLLRMCRVCHGRGVVRGPDGSSVKCSCNGGYVTCTTCRGRGVAHAITLKYFEDAPRAMRELWIPSHLAGHAGLFRLERAMETMVDLARDPPEDLRCHDLTGRVQGSAYRGGERTVRPSFHGHDFGDTIERALEALKALGGGMHVIHYDVRAYAWPLLRLQYGDPRGTGKQRDVALYVNRDGRSCVFGE